MKSPRSLPYNRNKLSHQGVSLDVVYQPRLCLLTNQVSLIKAHLKLPLIDWIYWLIWWDIPLDLPGQASILFICYNIIFGIFQHAIGFNFPNWEKELPRPYWPSFLRERLSNMRGPVRIEPYLNWHFIFPEVTFAFRLFLWHCVKLSGYNGFEKCGWY